MALEAVRRRLQIIMAALLECHFELCLLEFTSSRALETPSVARVARPHTAHAFP